MVFDESIIKNRVWRNELNRILLDPDARDQSRLFLVCYCKEKLLWDVEKICWFLGYYCRWSDYKERETKRQVENIFKRYEKGLVGSNVFHGRRFKASFVTRGLDETRDSTKPTGEEPSSVTVPVRVYSHETNRCKAHELFFFLPNEKEYFSPKANKWVRIWDPPKAEASVGFDMVSSLPEARGEAERPEMEETKIFGTINDGNRYYRVVEKAGAYGSFMSLDSGQLFDTETDEGKPITVRGKPNKFFSLPKDPKVLRELIIVLQKTLGEPQKKK